MSFDVYATAISIAREKASDRDLEAEFVVADALQLDRLGREFNTVLDCGLFHSFDSDDRREYVKSLGAVTQCGAKLFVLCFSNAGPDTGPHPVSEGELRAAFGPSRGWRVASFDPERLQTRFHASGAPAWLARIDRI